MFRVNDGAQVDIRHLDARGFLWRSEIYSLVRQSFYDTHETLTLNLDGECALPDILSGTHVELPAIVQLGIRHQDRVSATHAELHVAPLNLLPLVHRVRIDPRRIAQGILERTEVVTDLLEDAIAFLPLFKEVRRKRN